VCYKYFKHLNEAKSVEDILNLICIIKINILDIKKFLLINKNWHKAVSFYISHFRELQYKLKHQELTDFDKKILTINKKLICGHNKFLFQYINAFPNDPEVLKLLKSIRCVHCKKLMCTRFCEISFDFYDLILLLNSPNINIRKFVLTKLNYLEINKLINFVSLLVKYLFNEDKSDMILLDFLIEKSMNSFEFRNKLFFEINYNIAINYYADYYWNIKNIFLKKVKDLMGDYIKDQLLLSESFISELIKVSEINNKQSYFKNVVLTFNNHFYFPLKDVSFETINYNNVKIFDSSTKPIKIPLVSGTMEYDVILKKENVRKDFVICDIIKVAIDILKEQKIFLDFEIYNILPINDKYGFIEVKNNSTTLYDINESGMSLFSYIIEKNKERNIKDIRTTFINSLSLYCVITHLFGIGDRHLDNIMVCDNGSIFHIDYSYIFSDPKNIETGMRITKDMVDVMGGQESEEFQLFKNQTTHIYNHLRKYINIFLEMIMLLEDDLGKEFILNEIIKRFEPKEKLCNAELHLVTNIENSTNSYNHKMGDWIHYIYKKTSGFM